MKVVLDTNVLVAALLVSDGVGTEILRQFRDKDWELIISGKILEEYGEVLGRARFPLRKGLVGALINELNQHATSVIPHKRYAAVPSDPDDNEFIDVAVEASVDYVVSGDKALLSLGKFRRIPIITPTDFLARRGTRRKK